MKKSEILRQELERLLSDKQSVEKQLDLARQENAIYQDYIDNDWYLRAKNAARHFGRLIYKKQNELGKQLKKERQEQSESYERIFVIEAFRQLPREIYDSISTKAKEHLND